MDTTQFSVFCVKFLQSFGNHISFPHQSRDSTARTMETRTRMRQSPSDNGKAIKDWVQETELLGTVGVNRLVGGTALGDTMELHVFCDASLEATAAVTYIKTTRNHNSFSYG